VDLPFSEYLVLNCNSNASSRRAPKSTWQELLGQLEAANFVLTGGPGEAERVAQYQAYFEQNLPQHQFYSVAGKTNVDQLIWVMRGAYAMLTNDSGPAHLGHMLGVPAVIFCGAAELANTGWTYGLGPNLCLERKLDCAPCVKNVCPLGTIDCLRDFGSLLDSVVPFLDRHARVD